MFNPFKIFSWRQQKDAEFQRLLKEQKAMYDALALQMNNLNNSYKPMPYLPNNITTSGSGYTPNVWTTTTTNVTSFGPLVQQNSGFMQPAVPLSDEKINKLKEIFEGTNPDEKWKEDKLNSIFEGTNPDS